MKKEVAEEYLQKLEKLLVLHDEGVIPVEYDDSGKPIRWKEYRSNEAVFYYKILLELEGWYQEVKYGKRRRDNNIQ